ncbi:MAG: TIGR01906 family membrane protein [Clostridiales bacterium]|nr:TIGR01906 family membrane protein [Clostridiales bacterium]
MRTLFEGFLIAVLVLLFSTALSLAIIHITYFPYTTDIENLKLCENTGLSREEIMLNFKAVMNYLSPFYSGIFTLPTLRYSQTGAYHFAQCKIMFNAVYFAGLLSALALSSAAANKVVSPLALRISAVLTLAAPVMLAATFAVDFDKAFTLFHNLFFDSNTWLFNPKSDPIIKILPMPFFMHCALFIALFWIIGAAFQFALGLKNYKG